MCVLPEPILPALNEELLLDRILTQIPGAIARLDQGANLLFANCGRGEALAGLAHRFPQSRFFGLEASGYDRSVARQTVRASWLQNLWIEPDSAHLPYLANSFHLALRMLHPAGTDLAEIARLLKEDGLVFDVHLAPPVLRPYRSAGLTVLRSVRLPDGFCTIARK